MSVFLNLGCAKKDIGKQYINIDGMDWDGFPDAICNLTQIPFRLKIKHPKKFGEEWDLFEDTIDREVIIPNNFVDKIVMEEVLEHISFKSTDSVLKEIYRILKPDGILYLQVPDVGKSMEYYVNGEICKCCAHKPKDVADGKGKENCLSCKGKGKIHPNRWLYSFLGASKHNLDHHLNIFTKRSLTKALERAGFSKIESKEDEHGWKLKVNCIK